MTDHTTQPAEEERQGVPIGLIITGVLSVVVVIFIISNNNDVPVKFLNWDFTMPLYGVIFVSAILGGALALTFSAIRRRSKRKAAAGG